MSSRNDYRRLLLHCHRTGRPATEARNELMRSMGDNVPSLATCYRWYQRFDQNDFSLEELPRSGRPLSSNSNAVLACVQSNPDQSLRYMEKATRTPSSTVRRILVRERYRAKRPGTIPRSLTVAQRRKRVETCQKLLHRKRTTAWIASVVAQDKKWIWYDNPERKLEWVPVNQKPKPVSKRSEHCKKELLSFFFTSDGCIHYDILSEGETVTSEAFCSQLREMVSKAPRSLLHRGKIHLIMDNARPHYAKTTRDELERLGIEWLPHPAYSPDLSPCDYHAFRRIQAFCAGKTFDCRDDVKRAVDQWISSRSSSFWMDGIAAWPVRWRKVVATDGNYCE